MWYYTLDMSEKNNGVNLCGDLLITISYFHDIETNIFTIDLLLDPSIFTDINGIVFNCKYIC